MAHIIDESSCKMRCCNKCDMYRKELQHYKDLEEKGLLVELPCKVGDTVYWLNEDKKSYCDCKIVSVSIDMYLQGKDRIVYVADGRECGRVGFINDAIGIQVLLTQSEAEQALKY